MPVVRELLEALSILDGLQDVIATRPSRADAPAWATSRGWTSFLSGIEDDELDLAERDPASWLARSDAPVMLRTLATRIETFCARYETSRPLRDGVPRRHLKKRKQAQVDAIAEVVMSRFESVGRVVEVGSGHGHLLRFLVERLDIDRALGVEQDAARVARARELGEGSAKLHFLRSDAAETQLRASDLVVGLHACGELTDALVRNACRVGADVLAVGCCYQKVGSERRRGVSRAGQSFVVPRAALGLANFAPSSFEGSASLAQKRSARRTRLALRLALEKRGLELGVGDEARGLTKERIRHGLAAVAPDAFARRGQSAPSSSELEHARREAHQVHGAVSRFGLPRHALARVLELAIALDRASLLEEHGFDVDVRPLYARAVSPRNVAIVASRRRESSPS